jgi:hypothetical protein
MTDTMERILVLLVRHARGHHPLRGEAMTCLDMAHGLGFRSGSDRRSARDGRVMSPAQRVIQPVTALRKLGLLRLAPRPDRLTGTAYALTEEGEREADKLIEAGALARRVEHKVEVVQANTMVYHAVCSCGWRSSPSNIAAFAHNDGERHVAMARTGVPAPFDG